MIITGDDTQKDLPKDTRSGLDVAVQVLRKVDDISFCQLTSSDVVRHPLVQKIVQAYEAYEKRPGRQRTANGQAGRKGDKMTVLLKMRPDVSFHFPASRWRRM